MGDRVQLQQVMMNLILNSIEAMREADGTRELAIKSQPAEDGQLVISVSDTGAGLPPQQAEQIFNAFLPPSVMGPVWGFPSADQSLKSHAGRLWAAANSPRGARFFITLPAQVEALE